MQILANCITCEQRAGRLCGVHVPHLHLEYVQAAYVDDTHLILHTSLENLVTAKSILQYFSDASGLHIQWAKSEASWLSTVPRPPEIDVL